MKSTRTLVILACFLLAVSAGAQKIPVVVMNTGTIERSVSLDPADPELTVERLAPGMATLLGRPVEAREWPLFLKVHAGVWDSYRNREGKSILHGLQAGHAYVVLAGDDATVQVLDLPLPTEGSAALAFLNRSSGVLSIQASVEYNKNPVLSLPALAPGVHSGFGVFSREIDLDLFWTTAPMPRDRAFHQSPLDGLLSPGRWSLLVFSDPRGTTDWRPLVVDLPPADSL